MTETELSILNRSQNVLTELRSLSNIKFGEYWNTYTTSPQKANLLTSLIRTVWYTHEKREITLTYITALMDKSFSLIEDAYTELKITKNKKYTELIKNIKIGILNSQTGIINLKGIYYKDEKIKADIDYVIKSIKEKYNEIQLNHSRDISIPYNI